MESRRLMRKIKRGVNGTIERNKRLRCKIGSACEIDSNFHNVSINATMFGSRNWMELILKE